MINNLSSREKISLVLKIVLGFMDNLSYKKILFRDKKYFTYGWVIYINIMHNMYVVMFVCACEWYIREPPLRDGGC